MPEKPKKKNLAKVGDAAELLGVCERTVFQLCKTGGLPHLRLGKRILRFDLDRIQEWIERERGVNL